MTNRPIEKKSARPGDLSSVDDYGVAGAKQYDRHGEENGHHADTAEPARAPTAQPVVQKQGDLPKTDGGPNTLGDQRASKNQDNEGQQGGQYGGSQGQNR